MKSVNKEIEENVDRKRHKTNEKKNCCQRINESGIRLKVKNNRRFERQINFPKMKNRRQLFKGEHLMRRKSNLLKL